jgi:hypothetical protein
MSERSSIHPNICHGQACITGTLLPVPPVERMFANGGAASTDLFRPCRVLALFERPRHPPLKRWAIVTMSLAGQVH